MPPGRFPLPLSAKAATDRTNSAGSKPQGGAASPGGGALQPPGLAKPRPRGLCSFSLGSLCVVTADAIRCEVWDAPRCCSFCFSRSPSRRPWCRAANRSVGPRIPTRRHSRPGRRSARRPVRGDQRIPCRPPRGLAATAQAPLAPAMTRLATWIHADRYAERLARCLPASQAGRVRAASDVRRLGHGDGHGRDRRRLVQHEAGAAAAVGPAEPSSAGRTRRPSTSCSKGSDAFGRASWRTLVADYFVTAAAGKALALLADAGAGAGSNGRHRRGSSSPRVPGSRCRLWRSTSAPGDRRWPGSGRLPPLSRSETCCW